MLKCKIVRSSDLNTLEMEINNRMAEGYRIPSGSSITVNAANTYFILLVK